MNALDLSCVRGFHSADFVDGLQVQPKLFGGAKKAGKTDGSVDADATALKNDIVDARRRDMQALGQFIRGHVHRLQKFFAQDFTGVEAPVRCALSRNGHKVLLPRRYEPAV